MSSPVDHAVEEIDSPESTIANDELIAEIEPTLPKNVPHVFISSLAQNLPYVAHQFLLIHCFYRYRQTLDFQV